MRTMYTLKSDAQEKVDYYEEDESLIDAHERYYGESELVSEVDRITRAMWAGTAAKSTGITGAIVREDFKTVLRGTLPTTQERIRWENPNPETKERLAHDVVLSAPKSISMALHLQGDMRVFDAHTEAVLETLDLIEQEAAKTRIQVNGVRSVVHTGNLIAALIPHHTSRDGDMQLHTHMLIMNGTQGPDGVWRSLCHESLASAEWVGSYYRQKLAEKVQALGYRIYETKDGFELEGYSREEIEVFSKRNRAIVRDVMNKGLEVNPENKKASVLTTRKAKSGIGKKIEEIQEQWRAEALEEGIHGPVLDRPVEVNGSVAKEIQEVNSAIRHLSERSVSFSRSEIYAYAFKHIHQKGLLIEHLNDAIVQRKDLIPVQQGRWTTVEALEREISTVQQWNRGQRKAAAIMDTEAATTALMGSSLNSGQHEAVLRVVSATDRHLIIQGLSGVGKTHALGELKRLIEASGQDITIKGYSPTLNAAQQLQDSLGIETHTVESLVRRETESTPHQLWIIDEAGMVGGEQMLTIVTKAEAVGARILLVGDIGQNPSVKAGSPMRNLMDNGATTFRLSQIIRQQNSMQRRAVELIANGQPVDALRLLNEHGYVQEIQAQGVRVKAIAEQYLSLDLTERSKTLIVTGTNAERQAITKTIRGGMKVEGSLGQERTILQLTNQYMSAEEKRRVENFEPGSYVQLLQDYKTTPLVKNKLYQVMGREGAELIVSSEGGRLYRFDPSKYGDKEVFKAEEFAVAVGDRLRWTASNKKAGQINGIEFTVIGMTEQQLIVADKKGTRIIETQQPLGVDYALVSTSYRAQGQTAKRVIVSATNGPTAAQEPFYVKISRQTHEIQVYAEDIDRLKDWVQRSIAQENALDLIGESYGNGNQSRTKAGLNPSAASSPSTAKRSAPTTEPDFTAAERGLELLGEGADEHIAPGSESPAQQLHRRIHRGHEQPEVGQDGRINRQALESNGQLGDEVRGLEHGESPDEHPSRRVSRPNQADLQTASPERNAEDTEAAKDWIRDQFSSLAQALSQLQTEAQLNSALGERIGRLSQQLERLSSNPLDEPFTGMTQLVQAVSEQAEWAEWSQVTDSLSDLVESIERRSQMTELAQQLGALAEEQGLSQSGLAEKLDALHDRLSQFSRTIPSQFEGMNALAQTLNETTPIEALIALNEQMEALTEKLNQTIAGPEHFQDESMGQLAAAVIASQQLQVLQVNDLALKIDVLIEKLEGIQAPNIQQFENMDALAQRLSDASQLEALSALSDQTQTLSERLEIPVTPTRANRFESMSEVASAVIATEQQQILESSDLTTKIEALLEQVEGVITEHQPSTQFEGMTALAEALSSQQQQSSLIEAIAQVGSELERFTEGLTYATRRDKAATIGAAIQQWRSEQFISEQVLQTNPEQALQSLETVLAQVDAFGDVRPEMQELVTAIRTWQSEQALSQTIEQLSERLPVPVHTWANISQMAQVISERHAQESIAEHLEQFNAFSEQLQGRLSQRTDLRQLAEAVRTLRSIELAEGPAAEQLQQIAQHLRQMDISPTPKPIKQQVFWKPDYTTAECPDNLEPHHWEEFQHSGIHPDLIIANAESASGEGVYERLLSERLAQMGTGQFVTQPMARLMAQYKQVAEGGWWGKAGIDAKSLVNLTPGQQPQLSTWGCFKADNPRIDQDKTERKGETEFIKYENPLGVSRSLYLPIVPDSLAERIYEKQGIEPTAAEKQSGFWAVVHQYNLPITVTEGAKKTWASLSQGEVTIGVSGVNGLYRAKDQEGNLLPVRQLNEEMAIFATPGREFRFAFDQDTKSSTVRNVRRDMVRGIELLEAQGCTCKVASWRPSEGKGLDDLIVNRGPASYTSAIAQAESSDKAKRTHYRTEYNLISRQVRVNYPEATPELLDTEVYLRAIAKGELKDGERFISQSDQARSLKDHEAVAAYIEHIKAAAPLYRQQLQALEIAKNQERKDRTLYEELAQSITAEMGALKPGPLDIEVCIRLTFDNPNLERILAQSDWAKSRETPEDKTHYIQSIQTAAFLTLQQRQTAQDRAEYETLAAQFRKSPVQQSSEVVDMQVYLIAEQQGNPGDGDRLIAQSDHARSLNGPEQVQAYVDHIKTHAPQYAQQQQELEAAKAAAQAQQQQELAAAQAKAQAQAEAQQAADRAKYLAIIQSVQKADPNISIDKLDIAAYMVAQHIGDDPDRILAQSDQARFHPNQAQTYIENIHNDVIRYRQQHTTMQAQRQKAPVQSPVQPELPAKQPQPIRAITEPQKAQQKVDQAVASIKQELRAQYDDIAQQVKSKQGDVPPEVLDLEIYLSTNNVEQAKKLIQVGDTLTAMRQSNSDFADFYFDAVARVAPAYAEIKNDPNAKLNHRMMAAIVTNTTAKLLVENRPQPTIHRKKERENELML